MKNSIIPARLLTLGSSSAALASAGGEGDGSGIMAYLFLGFFGMIIATQMAPGTLLFVWLLKGLFGKTKESTPSMTHERS